MPPPRPRVLIVGPLPPPLGGVQRMIEMLAGSSLSREFMANSGAVSTRSKFRYNFIRGSLS